MMESAKKVPPQRRAKRQIEGKDEEVERGNEESKKVEKRTTTNRRTDTIED